jgi:hypothetical protein
MAAGRVSPGARRPVGLVRSAYGASADGRSLIC